MQSVERLACKRRERRTPGARMLVRPASCLAEYGLEFGASQHFSATDLRRALLGPPLPESRDEHIPVARLAKRRQQAAQPTVEPLRFARDLSEDPHHRTQPANAHAQLVQVFWISTVEGAGEIRRDLRERGCNERVASRAGNAGAIDPRLLPLARESAEFGGVTDGIRTRNNWNHNPGLYR
ncbi:MAG: hypothetical protein QOD26_4058 [Betaproteobacteria bacterium]|nr:hypothetical protein [Betaproteobacteria bacterium]